MARAEYEYENQEELKYIWYLQISGRGDEYAPVRRIKCKGCERVYFTQVHCVKFCYRCQQGNVGAMYVKRRKSLERRENTVCKNCGNTFTPKRAGAVYCSSACRQKAYRKRVTEVVSDPKDHLL